MAEPVKLRAILGQGHAYPYDHSVPNGILKKLRRSLTQLGKYGFCGAIPKEGSELRGSPFLRIMGSIPVATNNACIILRQNWEMHARLLQALQDRFPIQTCAFMLGTIGIEVITAGFLPGQFGIRQKFDKDVVAQHCERSDWVNALAWYRREQEENESAPPTLRQPPPQTHLQLVR